MISYWLDVLKENCMLNKCLYLNLYMWGFFHTKHGLKSRYWYWYRDYRPIVLSVNIGNTGHIGKFWYYRGNIVSDTSKLDMILPIYIGISRYLKPWYKVNISCHKAHYIHYNYVFRFLDSTSFFMFLRSGFSILYVTALIYYFSMLLMSSNMTMHT